MPVGCSRGCVQPGSLHWSNSQRRSRSIAKGLLLIIIVATLWTNASTPYAATSEPHRLSYDFKLWPGTLPVHKRRHTSIHCSYRLEGNSNIFLKRFGNRLRRHSFPNSSGASSLPSDTLAPYFPWTFDLTLGSSMRIRSTVSNKCPSVEPFP